VLSRKSRKQQQNSHLAKRKGERGTPRLVSPFLGGPMGKRKNRKKEKKSLGRNTERREKAAEGGERKTFIPLRGTRRPYRGKRGET